MRPPPENNRCYRRGVANFSGFDQLDKPITTGKLAEAQMSEEDKRAILFSNKSVADGGMQYAGTQDGDVLNGMGAMPAPTASKPAETNNPTSSVGGNIATLPET